MRPRPMVLFPNINSNLVTWSHRLPLRCETKARCIETDRGRRDEDVNCDTAGARSHLRWLLLLLVPRFDSPIDSDRRN